MNSRFQRHGLRFRRAVGGFTLLEVLAAFVIMASALTALIGIFGAGIRNADASAGYSRAVQLAESRLALVGIEYPLRVGELSGESEDRHYRWRLAIKPYAPPAATAPDKPEPEKPVDNNAENAAVNLPVQLFLVEARVDWGDGAAARHISLLTQRLGPK